MFLYRHPQALHSAEEISECIGRDTKEVEEALSELEKAGIVARKQEQDNALYFFQPRKEWIKSIEKFIQCLSDRNKRFLVLAHIFEIKGKQG